MFQNILPFCTKNIYYLKKIIKKYRVVMATLDATTQTCVQSQSRDIQRRN